MGQPGRAGPSACTADVAGTLPTDPRAPYSGRSTGSFCTAPSNLSSANSTSSFQESVVRSSRRSRGYVGCGRTVLNPTARRWSAGRTQAGLLPAGVPEGLDRLEAPPEQILRDRLDHHTSKSLPLKARRDEGGHQLDRVRGDRARGEGRRPRHIGGRRVEHETRLRHHPRTRPGRRIPIRAGRRRSTPLSPALVFLPLPRPDR